MCDADEKWEALLKEHSEWVNRPEQPPGLSRSGIIETATAMVEARRRKQQQEMAAGGGSNGNGAGAGPKAQANTVHA